MVLFSQSRLLPWILTNTKQTRTKKKYCGTHCLCLESTSRAPKHQKRCTKNSLLQPATEKHTAQSPGKVVKATLHGLINLHVTTVVTNSPSVWALHPPCCALPTEVS